MIEKYKYLGFGININGEDCRNNKELDKNIYSGDYLKEHENYEDIKLSGIYKLNKFIMFNKMTRADYVLWAIVNKFIVEVDKHDGKNIYKLSNKDSGKTIVIKRREYDFVLYMINKGLDNESAVIKCVDIIKNCGDIKKLGEITGVERVGNKRKFKEVGVNEIDKIIADNERLRIENELLKEIIQNTIYNINDTVINSVLNKLNISNINILRCDFENLLLESKDIDVLHILYIINYFNENKLTFIRSGEYRGGELGHIDKKDIIGYLLKTFSEKVIDKRNECIIGLNIVYEKEKEDRYVILCRDGNVGIKRERRGAERKHGTMVINGRYLTSAFRDKEIFRKLCIVGAIEYNGNLDAFNLVYSLI